MINAMMIRATMIQAPTIAWSSTLVLTPGAAGLVA